MADDENPDGRSLPHRRARLHQLRRMLVEQESAIGAALHDDLGKSAFEAYTTEIGFVIGEIDHTLRHLAAWTKPRRVRLPIHMRPGSARVEPEPLGRVLIIAPWNYPLQLTLAPVVSALAAGNSVVLKPSDLAPATAAAIERLIPQYLDEAFVRVVTGGVAETTALLEERFDHIFFTGSGKVGRIVMTAAAQHLTPVTLELGGKSPAIVTDQVNVEVAARRVAWGKFINAGQTCVAPDYVLVDASVADEFSAAVCEAIESFFGPDPSASPDFGRIINELHHDRLTRLLDAGGYAGKYGGVHDRAKRYLAPTVLTGVGHDAEVMSDEIFGPILPIVSVGSTDEAIAFVADRPDPLALYVFSDDAATADRIVSGTRSGGVTVNHTLLHVTVPDLPFGGRGSSGMGACHGESGFRTFSHDKAVLRRGSRPDPAMAYPPYSARLIKAMRKLR